MSAMGSLAASGVSKSFGKRVAVRGVDLVLAGGDCLALFGPNGAGKTTLLRLIAGLLKPTSGSVVVNDRSVRGEPSARVGVGLISHERMLYAPLTARENVEFSARLYGLHDPCGATNQALASMQVLDRADVAVRTLSRGLQQRVSIARAMVHAPSVVLLDEPYSGLDEAGAVTLTTVLAGLRARGATLVIVTHNVTEGLALATHAAIMTDGAFVRFEKRASPGAWDAARYAAEYREAIGVHREG